MFLESGECVHCIIIPCIPCTFLLHNLCTLQARSQHSTKVFFFSSIIFMIFLESVECSEHLHFKHAFFTFCACSLYLVCTLMHTPSIQYVCTTFPLLYFKYPTFFNMRSVQHIRPMVKKSAQSELWFNFNWVFRHFWAIFWKSSQKRRKNFVKVEPHLQLCWFFHLWSYNCEDQMNTNFQANQLTLILFTYNVFLFFYAIFSDQNVINIFFWRKKIMNLHTQIQET